MWWYGRGNSGGSWLPEEKKANMWPGRGKVVAHGRLPSPTPWRCELKGAVRVFQVTVHVKKAAAGNAQITRVISKRCYIKYELDINIYNFENWLLFYYGFSTKVHFHGHVTCVFLLKEKTGLNRFISKNDNIFQTIDQDQPFQTSFAGDSFIWKVENMLSTLEAQFGD